MYKLCVASWMRWQGGGCTVDNGCCLDRSVWGSGRGCFVVGLYARSSCVRSLDALLQAYTLVPPVFVHWMHYPPVLAPPNSILMASASFGWHGVCI